MNILAINGSYRGEKGHTHQWLECLASGARTDGASFEIVNLARLKINHCLGCDVCHTSDHYLKCVLAQKDDVNSIFTKIIASDLVIYATPVYVFGISSLMKAFLDRLYCTSDVDQLRVTRSGMFFHHINESICSKPFVSLICCDNLDAEMPRNVRNYFRTFARFMDAPHAGELIRDSGKIFEKAGNSVGLEGFPRIRKVYAAFEQAGYELSQSGRIHPATQRQACQQIIPVPFFHILKRFRFFKKVMVIQASAMFPPDS